MTDTRPEAHTETLALDRMETPVGEMLIVTDSESAVRALDFADFEARMHKLLARHAPGATLTPGVPPRPSGVRLWRTSTAMSAPWTPCG